MVELITRDALRAEASSLTLVEEASILRKAEQQTAVNAVFLSHSSKDADRLPGVIKLLERHGAVSVYIDKIDTSLPRVTSRETADKLKRRIRSCRKFVLLTSPTSKDSRWMPWELGLADGYKEMPNVAVLPSPEDANDTNWAEQEYLGVYDRIVRERSFDRSPPYRYLVQNPDTKSTVDLRTWLTR